MLVYTIPTQAVMFLVHHKHVTEQKKASLSHELLKKGANEFISHGLIRLPRYKLIVLDHVLSCLYCQNDKIDII